jgi:hypothetical protein
MGNSIDSAGGSKNRGINLVVPLCAALSVLFIGLTLLTSSQKTGSEPLDPRWFTPTTARGEELKHKVMVGNCSLCHAYWTGIPDPDVVRPLFAHAVMTLDHGENDRCYNCHLIQDRNKFTANNGSGIMHTTVELLCARCHGLIYNDWVAGTHGVRRGQWMTPGAFGLQNFKCTQCHDPHAPQFKFSTFAPPPVWPQHIVRSNTAAPQTVKASE